MASSFATRASPRRRHQFTVALLLALACARLSAGGVRAHTWLMSRSRASREASTTAPWRARKETDTHAQVGPGQHIILKWAAAHVGWYYVVVLSGDHQERALLRDNAAYYAAVNDYIDTAPSDAHLALTKPRAHGTYKAYSYYDEGRLCNPKAATYSEALCPTGRFAGRVEAGDANYLSHPDEPTAFQYAFSPGILGGKSNIILITGGDRRVAYKSAKYPWIVAAHRYQNLHDGAQFHHEYDVTSVEFPNAPPGHYLVHWAWAGDVAHPEGRYFDVVDVHVHPDPVPTDEIYGNGTGRMKWVRVDHCSYLDPKRVVTPMFDATANADECVKAVEAFNERYAKSPGTNGANYPNELGVNVVPVELPEEVSRVVTRGLEKEQPKIFEAACADTSAAPGGLCRVPLANGDAHCANPVNQFCEDPDATLCFDNSKQAALSTLSTQTKVTNDAPFAEPMAAYTPLLRAQTGNVTRAAVNWTEWRARTNALPGKRCRERDFKYDLDRYTWKWRRVNATLREAVEECSANVPEDCGGVAWLRKGRSADAVYEGKHTFLICAQHDLDDTWVEVGSNWIGHWGKRPNVEETHGYPYLKYKSKQVPCVNCTHCREMMRNRPVLSFRNPSNGFWLETNGTHLNVTAREGMSHRAWSDVAWTDDVHVTCARSAGDPRHVYDPADPVGAVDDAEWDLFVKKTPAANPGRIPRTPIAAPYAKVSFNPRRMYDIDAKRWADFNASWADRMADSGFLSDFGEAYAAHGAGGSATRAAPYARRVGFNASFGWLCQPKMGAAVYGAGFDFREDPDIQDRTYAHWLGTEMCHAAGKPNRWEMEVPNGTYVVTAYFNKYVFNKAGKATNKELGRMLGCTFEGVRSPVWDAYTTLLPPWMYASTGVITTEVRDGKLTVGAQGDCQTLNWLKVDRLPDDQAFPEAWLPASDDEWWQTEVTPDGTYAGKNASAIGLVVIDPHGVNEMTPDSTPLLARTHLQDPRRRWLYEGNRVYRGPRGAMSGPHPDLYSRVGDPRSPERWCRATDGRGMEGPGNVIPSGKNYCFHRENDPYEEWGTYEGPEDHRTGNVGFEVQVIGGGPSGNGVTSCGFVNTVGDCKERKYPYTVSERMWKQQCVIEVDCKGAVGTHVRVVLPGKNRIFAVRGVRVHRHRPLPPSESTIDAVAVARGLLTGGHKPRPMVCYGVEARERLPDNDPNTLLAAKQHERLRTRNPRDPAFYSSCLMFTKDVSFRPLSGGGGAEDNVTAEALDLMEPVGGGCLTCESKASLRTLRTTDTPHFFLRPRGDTCAPCDSSPSPPPLPPPAPPPPPSPPSPPPRTTKGLSPAEIKRAIDEAKAEREAAKKKRAVAKQRAEAAAAKAKAAKAAAAKARAVATATRDKVVARIYDAKKAKLARIAADAAIAGVKVKTLRASVSADNETEACDRTLAAMKITADEAACQVSTSEVQRTRRRRLLSRARSLAQDASAATDTFTVEVVVDPAAAAVNATVAEKNLAATGVNVTVVQQEPLAVLATVVSGDDLEVLRSDTKSAADAAAAAAAAETDSTVAANELKEADDLVSSAESAEVALTREADEAAAAAPPPAAEEPPTYVAPKSHGVRVRSLVGVLVAAYVAAVLS